MSKILSAAFAPLFFLSAISLGQSTQPTSFDFVFTSRPAFGAGNIASAQPYDDATGYGFEPGAKVSIDGNASAEQPFYFSVKVPEGNYRITLKLGDADKESTTTVKTELRRLALQQIHAAAGHFVTETITANVRQPEIPGGGQVHLKPREMQKTPGGEWFEWDNKLELEFSGDHPSVERIQIEKVDDLPTVYLCGDSTMCDQPAEPFDSWGQMLPRWFKPTVVIANNAESGETLKDFFNAKRMDKIMSTLKAGDYVFVQFGHNDMKPASQEPVDAYKGYYQKIIDLAHSRGATPVILTPVSRKSFGDDGKITNSFGDYPDAVRQLAKDQHVAFIDLQNLAAQTYEAIGKDHIQPFFATASEGTHHSDWGSFNIAQIIVQGIVDNQLPLAKDVVDDWKPFDANHPLMMDQFTLPKDPLVGRTSTTPLGN